MAEDKIGREDWRDREGYVDPNIQFANKDELAPFEQFLGTDRFSLHESLSENSLRFDTIAGRHFREKRGENRGQAEFRDEGLDNSIHFSYNPFWQRTYFKEMPIGAKFLWEENRYVKVSKHKAEFNNKKWEFHPLTPVFMRNSRKAFGE